MSSCTMSHGWYSEEDYRTYGCGIYLNPNGQEVRCTMISSDSQYPHMTKPLDLTYMGLVTEMIGVDDFNSEYQIFTRNYDANQSYECFYGWYSRTDYELGGRSSFYEDENGQDVECTLVTFSLEEAEDYKSSYPDVIPHGIVRNIPYLDVYC